jgi:hypothetical protein
MQNSADGGLPAPSEGLNDGFASIVSNLVSLVQHIQASIELIETAMDQESHAGDHEIGADIVVLDDVTPRYVKATAALSACNTSLGVALQFLPDTKTPGPQVDGVPVRRLSASA